MSEWVQLILLYAWLFGALWSLYRWSQMINKTMATCERFSTSINLLVSTGEATVKELTKSCAALPALLRQELAATVGEVCGENPLLSDEEKEKQE